MAASISPVVQQVAKIVPSLGERRIRSCGARECGFSFYIASVGPEHISKMNGVDAFAGSHRQKAATPGKSHATRLA